MKLLLIGSMLFTGSSAVAMENEVVKENVGEAFSHVREMFQKRYQNNRISNLRETGFSYPSGIGFDNLTEDQQFAIISTIDQINATYNWATMTDEDIDEALSVIKEEMQLLHEELGIETPVFHNRLQDGLEARGFNHRNRNREDCTNQEIITEPDNTDNDSDEV